ncbi:hypothetical protein D3981_004359 [Escherichia coli]|nr:hypothetical protein [Escherichia coli]
MEKVSNNAVWQNASLKIHLNPVRFSLCKGSNPAFEAWGDKLKPGEKLPRGKYFR